MSSSNPSVTARFGPKLEALGVWFSSTRRVIGRVKPPAVDGVRWRLWLGVIPITYANDVNTLLLTI